MSKSAQDQDRKTTVSRNWRFLWLSLIVAAVALLLDVTTKLWALDNLQQDVARPFIGNFITLQLVFNPGAAFSMGEGATWVFTIITGAVVVGLIWFASRIRETVPAIILGFLLGGSLGNLWDRLTQPPGFGRGHVVDFINYNNWFVGNVADIWIVGSAIALVLWVLVKSERERQDERESAKALKSADSVDD